jgi:hypothetical protein
MCLIKLTNQIDRYVLTQKSSKGETPIEPDRLFPARSWRNNGKEG